MWYWLGNRMSTRMLWRRWTSSPSSSSSSTSSSSSSSTTNLNDEDALKVLAYDTASGRPIGDPWTSRTYLKPPMIHESGCVIVHRAVDAQKYPTREYRVRRVVGLGGQICRVASTTSKDGGGGIGGQEVVVGGGDFVDNRNHNGDDYQWQTPRRWADRIVRVPPFALWVEGDADNGTNIDDDNREKPVSTSTDSRTMSSTDSRVHGPVCKNNVIGIAERIVWPPSRWGQIPSPPPCDAMASRLPRAWWL